MGAATPLSAPCFLAADGACGAQPPVLVEDPSVAVKADCSSASSVQLAAQHSQQSCVAKLLDEEGDASTTASISEPPPETPQVRWADLVEWEKREEEALLPLQALDSCYIVDNKPCSVNGPPPVAARTKWADLVDSDDEQLPQYLRGISSSVEPEVEAAIAAAAEITPSGSLHDGNSRLKAAKSGGRIPTASATKKGTEGKLTTLSGTSTAASATVGHAAPAICRQQRCLAVSCNGSWTEPSSDAITWPLWGERQQQHHDQQHKQKPKAAPTVAHETFEKDGEKKRRQSWSQNSGKQKHGAKHQCQFLVGIEEEPTFQVKRRLLGPHGQHMKAIAEASGVKLRLRGRGSGFLEGVEQEESADPLMLCISAPDAAVYKYAVKLTRELLDGIHRDFCQFCMEVGWPVPSLVLHIHEGPRPGSR